MTTEKIQIVGIAGGSGTRLWPLSRKAKPKQFLRLPGRESTLLQATYQRVSGLADAASWWLICNELHVKGAQESLPMLRPEQILAEPVGRNTAPAILWAALELESKGQVEDVMVVLPADQDVQNAKAWHEALATATAAALPGVIITLGIKPTRPDTGYGYIQIDSTQESRDGVFAVNAFHEKPNLVKAEGYVADGNFVWNAGVFVARASTFISEAERLKPELLAGLRRFMTTRLEGGDVRAAFGELESISIDYAIAEAAREVRVVPVDCGWSDVGSFATFESYLEPEGDTSNRRGPTDVLLDSEGVTILGDSNLRVAGLGLQDLLIVKADDVLMVVDKSQASQTKRLLAEMGENA